MDQIQELADKLKLLADQITSVSPATLGRALLQLEEYESSFLPAVDHLLNATAGPVVADPELTEWEWPEVEAEFFQVTVDLAFEPDGDGRPFLVMNADGKEIFREASGYQNVGHVAKVCKGLREAYKGRIKDIQLAPGASNGIVFDDDRGESRLRKAFRPIRKDYERTRAMGNQQEGQES
jgi:predicted transcriptional regulator